MPRSLASLQRWLLCMSLLSLAGLTAQTSRPASSDLQAVGDTPPTPHSVQSQGADVQTIFRLANASRAAQGLPLLTWSPELAAAAQAHAQRMAEAVQLSHRYEGEPDLATRSAEAGAHFTGIAENIAVGHSARQIDQEWLGSPPHRANILDPRMTALGIAVVPSIGALYAVEDFAALTAALSTDAVEHRVEQELASFGLPVAAVDARQGTRKTEARRICPLVTDTSDGGDDTGARYILHWQGSSLTLPQPLVQAAHSRQYSAVAVAACMPIGSQSTGFITYRVAVLLY